MMSSVKWPSEMKFGVCNDVNSYEKFYTARLFLAHCSQTTKSCQNFHVVLDKIFFWACAERKRFIEGKEKHHTSRFKRGPFFWWLLVIFNLFFSVQVLKLSRTVLIGLENRLRNAGIAVSYLFLNGLCHFSRVFKRSLDLQNRLAQA